MTSQYVTEPPSSGLVELHTSKGILLVTLFPREAPLACRNFLTLALEGFYDNLLFHRLIPQFIIQTGDPSNTGMGGESIYGEPFAIEPHSRLKFNRRGLLGMAASDRCNESQFFLTLDAAPELQGKHTLFGKLEGKSIYTLIELCEGVELDGDKPRYPIRLHEVRVVENPYDDLKPRMTKQQRREEELKRNQEVERKRAEEEKRKRSKVKKNTGLLSFGADEEGEPPALKGPKSLFDLVKSKDAVDKGTSKKSRKADVEMVKDSSDAEKQSVQVAPSTSSASIASSPPTAAVGSTDTSRSPKHAGILSSSSSRSNNDKANGRKASASSSTAAKDYLTSQRAKYLSSSSSSSSQSSSTTKDASYSALLSFQSRLRAQPSSSSTRNTPPRRSQHEAAPDEEDEEEAREYGASDDDDDDGDWRTHRLDAGGKPLTVSAGGARDKVDDYEVLDPRDHAQRMPSSDKGRDERASKQGKRGRDWVEDQRTYTHASSSNSTRDSRDGRQGGRSRSDGDSVRHRRHADDRGSDRDRGREHKRRS